MHNNTRKAINTTNWFVWQIGPKDVKEIHKIELELLFSIKKRLEYLLENIEDPNKAIKLEDFKPEDYL